MPRDGVPPPNEHLAAWLQYFDDLGLGNFYRDRGATPASLAARRVIRPGTRPVPAPPVVKPHISTMKPMAGGTVDAAAKVTALPIAHGPSLFETFERIEGDTLERIREDIGDCKRCRLCEQRHNIVFGVGSVKADLVFIGEGPGHDEDMKGEPFVGRAGKLLTDMIKAMGLERSDVYIANVVKCRPPENRMPEKDEVATCSPFLLRQLEVIKPKVIVCLGNVAAQNLLGTNKSISSFRGQWFDFRGSHLLATYHPAYLLRNPAAKGDVWNDLKKVMTFLGMKIPRIAPKK